MDFQNIAALIFILLLAGLLYWKRKKVNVQKILFPVVYLVMYRTKVGIKAMDKLAKKFPRFLKYLGYTGVVIGFLGMIFLTVSLTKNIINLLFIPTAAPGVGIVQPFSKNIPGTLFVPFFYFIISIFVLVIVHEFSHGVMARLYKVKIKSSGLAVLGLIAPVLPAAFVEPDENQIVKRSLWQQLSVFAAGPFSNILTAFIVIGLIFGLINPVIGQVVEYDGVLVSDLTKIDDQIFAAEKAGVQKGELIIGIGKSEIKNVQNFTKLLEDKSPGDKINLITNKTTYEVTLGENPQDKTKPYLGVFVGQHTKIKDDFKNKYGQISADIILWIAGLFLWLYILNLGIGLFNLVPIPICDGGRMLQLVMKRWIKNEKLAMKLWKYIGVLFIVLILVNIFAGFLK